ncbi:hypothetical protein DPMN_170964 [Dreissena polymorpha]|uniref:Uncharacterized protein n=1 Tax=Dreissena polymorpha TaxID=45954 RepID=A0A9D4DZK3_DREPO|nr:hypothetical protein DPMN_170964 [Dreissena polymorpha]
MRAPYGMRPSYAGHVWHETKLEVRVWHEDQAMQAWYGIRPSYVGHIWHETYLCGSRME